MRLSIWSLIMLSWLGFIHGVAAEDYVLDASRLTVGSIAGENLVVKEGCFDPTKTECADKLRWLTSSSAAKVGSVQVNGFLSGDFEIVVTADFANTEKTISLFTNDNQSIYLRTVGDSWGHTFNPNGIGTGGGTSNYSLGGWNSSNNFNEIKLIVQKGVANIYTNGVVFSKAITFDSATVFSKVTVAGIQINDRLSDVKVRGIQGTTACNSTGTGTTAPVATTKIDGVATNGFVSPANKMIAGVLISGGAKRSMVRASSVDGLVDPQVEIYTYPDRKLLGSNDSWATSTAATELTQKKLAPARATDAATIIELPPGLFTMEVTSKNGGSGASVIEVYDMAVFP